MESILPDYTESVYIEMLDTLLKVSEGRCRPGHRLDPRSGKCIKLRRSSFKGRYKFGSNRNKKRSSSYSFGQNRGTKKWAKN